MLDWFKRIFRRSKRHRRHRDDYAHEFRPAKLPPRRSQGQQITTASAGLRAVPGALVASSRAGQVIYNMLTPHMQQFMGRCIGAIKRAGIPAKGTGQFSIMVGEQRRELRLDQFYQPSDDPALVEVVVAEARRLANVA